MRYLQVNTRQLLQILLLSLQLHHWSCYSHQPIHSVSRIFPTVCLDRGRAYWDYGNQDLENENSFWRDVDDFRIIKMIGTGKFGTVFEGVDLAPPNRPDLKPSSGKRVIIKRLQPTVRPERVKREVHALRLLNQTAGVVKLWGAVQDPSTGAHSLVMEYLGEDAQWFCHDAGEPLTDFEIRLYLYQLLRVLHKCHSHGIMHRDVKPRNVLISPSRHKLTLIDFGLAEFYLPQQRYSCRVASRHYKGPEVLVGYGWYDYSLDLWGAGCMMAGLLFHKEPFFRGTNDATQLCAIVNVLGIQGLLDFLKKYNIKLVKETREALVNLGYAEKKDWRKLKTAENEDLCCPEGLDLLGRLLRYDPAERLTAKEAMAHPYFDPIRPYFRKKSQVSKGTRANTAFQQKNKH
mmetsp:Transcript_8694/g.11459  ORF Transcript_8694/g.11459 Transcript_8694/m.11459 type:complete len:403 (-) Transcript_8694:205-1413(-)